MEGHVRDIDSRRSDLEDNTLSPKGQNNGHKRLDPIGI
jgi:hypothetical protein